MPSRILLATWVLHFRTSLSTVLLLLLSSNSEAQLRIVTYNTSGGPRDGLATVLEAIGQEEHVPGILRPIDILLVQEQARVETDTVDIAAVLNTIHATDVYYAGEVNGDTTGGGVGRPGVVYRSDVVGLRNEKGLGEAGVDRHAREPLRYDFHLVGYPSDATIHNYNSHYKAGTSQEDKDRRFEEARAIREDSDQLATAPIIYAGDFNIQSSDEKMYQRLLCDGIEQVTFDCPVGAGQALDPINKPGRWHDNASFKLLHTQSPVKDDDTHFDGQIGGGMDDRFDFQLVSEELLDSEGLDYIAGSYRAFGNNDTHSLDGEITDTKNGLQENVLNALARASDHLPVVADYQVPARMHVEVSIPDVIAVNRSSEDWLVAVTNDGPNALAVDELDYEISFLGESFVVTDVEGGSRIEYPIPLDYRSLGTHSLQLSVLATSPLTANPSYSETISYIVALPGDTNLDGLFDSGDLVAVFTAGEYEDEVADNSGWAEGDWNGDAEFDSRDLIVAFQEGGYEQGLRVAVPEPSCVILLWIGMIGLCFVRGRREGPTPANHGHMGLEPESPR